jgi:flavorubredoxin
MPKAVIIYDSKWGNTRQVAEKIAEGLMEVPGTEATVIHHKQVDAGQLAEFDAIIVGSPNHIGTATWSIRRFLNGLGKAELEGKLVAVFDTYIQQDVGKAVRKMEKRLSQKAPGLQLVSPGLSIRVDGMKGPITEGELPRCREFGVMLAGKLKERAAAQA